MDWNKFIKIVFDKLLHNKMCKGRPETCWNQILGASDLKICIKEGQGQT